MTVLMHLWTSWDADRSKIISIKSLPTIYTSFTFYTLHKLESKKIETTKFTQLVLFPMGRAIKQFLPSRKIVSWISLFLLLPGQLLWRSALKITCGFFLLGIAQSIFCWCWIVIDLYPWGTFLMLRSLIHIFFIFRFVASVPMKRTRNSAQLNSFKNNLVYVPNYFS